jgi:C1A family cysteine protease
MHPVKNQGGCGSCWTFSANTALEGTMAYKYNSKPVHVAEQQIVDCTLNNQHNRDMFGKTYRGYGCSGGWMSWSWEFHKEQGFMYEEDYKYKARNQNCTHDADKVKGRVTEWK